MASLHELQHAMRAALLGGDVGPALEHVRGDGLDPGARVALYRHHVVTTLTAALEATFPVVCRLVDRRFFAYAADGYIRERPPSSPCLHEYGADFAGFLAAFEPARGLAYLADVARLEWAINCAEHAEDEPPISAADLAVVPPERVGDLAVRLEPSIALLSSPWPIDRIWRANQPGADPALVIDLASGVVNLEVRRAGDDVVFRALDEATWAFRSTLARGDTLADAAARALAADPGFDLATAIHDLLAEGAVVALVPTPADAGTERERHR
jgi:hypothetical protein